LFAATDAGRVKVSAAVDAGGRLRLEAGGVTAEYDWFAVAVSVRVADIPRRVSLPDGRVIESPDNDAIDAIERQMRPGAGAGLLHLVERRWPWALAAAAASLLLGWLLVSRGVPLLA